MQPKTIQQQFRQLRHVDGYADMNLQGSTAYQLVPAVHGSWKEAERRILFVIESIDSADIQAGKLFTHRKGKREGEEANLMIPTLRNTLEQAWFLYQEYLGRNSLTEEPETPDFAIGFVNFNACKYFHLKDTLRNNALVDCARRATAIIERMKPTDVVIFGDTAATYLLHREPDVQLLPFKRGWVRKTQIGEHKCRVMNTLDLEPLYNPHSGKDLDDDDDGFEDASGYADLLYYVCRHLCNAYAGKHLHSLKSIVPKWYLVDTIEKFDSFFDKLLAFEGPIGFDSETATLEAYTNQFYTHQYAFDETKTYVIPLDHPKTIFSEEELDYIKGKLKRLWATRKPDKLKLFVGMNLQFDFKVVRAQFDIPVIYHRAWDVAAAELMLDENLALFDRMKFRVGLEMVKVTQGNLRAIFTAYGNDLYWTLPFSKEQRATLIHVDICKNKDALDYCSLDAQSVLGIRRMQLERASKIRISPKRTYEDIFERHVSNQMSNTVHAISHMHQNGSHINLEYMEWLTEADSPLLKVKRDTVKELRELPSVQEANNRLLKEKGMRQEGLFGQSTMLFDISKGDGLLALFIGVLGFKPLRHTATGQPSLDKKFLAEYAPLSREAALVQEYRIATKLMSTYVVGWLKKIRGRLDSAKDMCLRASFSFFIVTGRLSSFDPNLQQVPSHGKSASAIKKAFTPRKGRINFAWDFNAAEVRQAAVLSGDEVLAAAFKIGTDLRVQYIKKPTEELRQRLKKEGDVHISNVKKFFGQWVDKSHPLRYAIKAAVFGALYGKGARSLGRELELEARNRHRDKILKLEKEIRAVKKELGQ